jgi:hypothetical protein
MIGDSSLANLIYINRLARRRAAQQRELWGPGWGFGQDYPTRLVTIVVPFSAGGPTDTLTRNLAVRACPSRSSSRSLSRTGWVWARTIGASHVAKAKPGGYAVLLWYIGMSTAPCCIASCRSIRSTTSNCGGVPEHRSRRRIASARASAARMIFHAGTHSASIDFGSGCE